MAIEVALWKLGERPEKVRFSSIDSEKKLEDLVAKDISLIHPNLLLIGRQVHTPYGKFIDLLALDGFGNLVVLELKKDRTPREVVAQVLDYGSWIRDLEDDDIASIFAKFQEKYTPDKEPLLLDDAFCQRFNTKEMPETLNDSHELIVVASQLDDSTERIINYLSEEHGVSINAIFFSFFRDGDNEYLSRAWLSDPEVVESKAEGKREHSAWNGEYYVSFGGNENRDWEEARTYGFISAGGGRWYTNTLKILEKGARIWINIPGRTGYVGVGIVAESVVPIEDFIVDNGSGEKVSICSLDNLKASRLRTESDDPDTSEQLVRVDWIKTVPTSEAIKEKGLFGNQHSAAKPKDKKWVHTIEVLSKRFGVNLNG